MGRLLRSAMSIAGFLLGDAALASDQPPPAHGREMGRLVDPNILEYSAKNVEIERAMQTARSTLQRFFQLGEAGIEGDYAVKIMLSDGDRVEHIWVGVPPDIGRDVGVIEGFLANEPTVPGYAIGDRIKFRIDDIEDWMINTGEVRFGGYTVRVMLKDLSPEQISEMNLVFRD